MIWNNAPHFCRLCWVYHCPQTIPSISGFLCLSDLTSAFVMDSPLFCHEQKHTSPGGRKRWQFEPAWLQTMGSRICGCWSQLTACACSLATDSTSRLHPSPYGAGLSGLRISSDFCCLKFSPQTDLYKRLKNFPPVLISSSMVLTLPQPCKRRLSVVYKIPQRLTRACVRLGLHPREWISRVYTVWGDLVPFFSQQLCWQNRLCWLVVYVNRRVFQIVRERRLISTGFLECFSCRAIMR